MRLLGGRVRLDRLLGPGPVGEVLLGEDTEGRQVAVKILRKDLTADPNVVRRFLEDRELLAGIRDPHLVGVRDLVVDGPELAIVMDLVPDGNLRQALAADGTLLPAEVARIGSATARGLAAVHDAGVLHRDLKPENVLLDSSVAAATPRLTDFGLFRLVAAAEPGRRTLLAGMAEYTAPELADDTGEPSQASDLYSLGIMLYEMCCGVTPFAGGSLFAVLGRHRTLLPGRPEGVPDPLWHVISRLLAKDPLERPGSAREVADALDRMGPELLYLPVAVRLDTPPPGQPVVDQASYAGGPGWIPGVPMQNKRPRWRRLALVLLAGLLLASGWLVWRTTAGAPPSGTPLAGDAGRASALPADPPAADATPVEPTTTVSAPVIAPDLVGRSLSDATEMLGPSVRITTVDTVDEKATDGTVLAQDPKPGARMTGEVRLTVARQPVLTYLDSLSETVGDWSAKAAALSGKTYPHSVLAYVGGCDTDSESVEFNISKGYRRLLATGGIEDNAEDSALQVLLEVFADGRKVYSSTIPFGRTVPVDVDLTGVLRLTVRWQPVAAGDPCYTDNYLVLGEARLLGLPSEAPQPTTTTTG